MSNSVTSYSMSCLFDLAVVLWGTVKKYCLKKPLLHVLFSVLSALSEIACDTTYS